jgi:signal peptidase I
VTDVTTDEALTPNDDEPAEPTAAQGRQRANVAQTVWYGTVALLAAFLVICAVWTLTGGRTFVVSTPSMSPSVPVGSLVLTRPVPPGGPKVGQIIAFHPPNEPKTTYTHRLVKILPDGTYSTKGDLDSSPDAWVITRKDIVGVASHHFKRVGWLVRALPWLALGAILLMGAVTFVPRRRRRIAYFVGGTVVLSVPVLVLQPLVRGVFAGSGLISGRIHAMVVNTGLLPLRFAMTGAPTQHTAPGYPATLIAPPPKNGHLLITGVVGLGFWGWLILVLVCLSPLLIALTVPPEWWDGEELEPSAESDAEPTGEPEPVPA